MKQTTIDILDRLTERYPALAPLHVNIFEAFQTICKAYNNGGVLYVCGNGGSAADAEHIVGELMKSFRKKRPADARIQESLTQMFGETGRILGETLEGGLPAISLCSHVSLKSAVANDTDPSNIYAQQLFSLGRAGDCRIAISTSGNAENCVRAAMIAKLTGMKTIALTGEKGGRLKEIAEVTISVPEHETYAVQELHLPVYHCLCAMLEEELF